MRSRGIRHAARWAARGVTAMAAIVLTWTLSSAGAEAVEVSKQATFNHTPDKVWAMIGDFGTIASWHPAVEKSTVDGDGGKGIHRDLTLGGGGGMIRELMLSYSLKDRNYSYAILESPLPIANYVAGLAVAPGPDSGSATVTWSSTFDAKGASDQEAAEIIGGIYQAGFDSLEKMLAGQ